MSLSSCTLTTVGEKLLTVRQPWASCFFAVPMKVIENRRWPTKYRGRLWIHAAKEDDHRGVHHDSVREALDPAGASIDDPAPVNLGALPHGAVLGHVTVIDCHPANVCCFPWGEQSPGIFHLMVVDPHPLREPIPWTGKLGIWEAEPTLERILTAATAVL